MRCLTIACSPESPCGGVLYPDRAINDDLARHGIWRQRFRCLNDHGFWTEAPPAEPDRIPRTHTTWCRTHACYRPCPQCSDRMRGVRRRALDKESA